MSHKGKMQLMFLIIAPPDQVVEGDRIFRSHGPWMVQRITAMGTRLF